MSRRNDQVDDEPVQADQTRPIGDTRGSEAGTRPDEQGISNRPGDEDEDEFDDEDDDDAETEDGEEETDTE